MHLLRSEGMLCLLTAVIWAAPAHAESLCLRSQAGDRSALYSVVAGSRFGISFLHSIYGTEVQEQFRITATGFETDKLRYSELRLAEFYGHDGAKLEQGWWIADNRGNQLRHLDIRMSEGSDFRILFGERSVGLTQNRRIGDHVRLSITPCGDASSGR
jgi:hypothetical protein